MLTLLIAAAVILIRKAKTAPEGIGLVDLDTLTPLTNADTKEGMKLLVTMTPAHPNWWDEDHKAYTCWLPELERVGMKGKQVRF